MYTEKTISKENIYKGKILSLNVHKVKLHNGDEAKREIVNHPGGVAIIGFKDKETILMVEQFRKPIELSILELPAGKLEYGEEPEECAIRELEEETGYRTNKITYLGKVITSPGFCDEYIYIYKAEDLYEGQLNLDDDEFLNCIEMKLSEVNEKIINGTIFDAKTICGISMALMK